jgi:hypothetical protein
MVRSFSLLLFTAFLLIPNFCQAQVFIGPAAPPPVPLPVKADPATEKKALDLIESLSDQVSNLHSPSNRMRAQCTVADLLWSRDEKRARSLFSSAVTQLAGRIAEIDYSDPEVYQDLNRLSMSRQELVMRIAAHDPDLAITALRQTRFQTDNSNIIARSGWNPQAEATLEMNVAGVILGKDPAAALKLARNSLARGVSWNVVAFLPQLYQKDQKAGQDLFQEIVTRIKNENLSRNTELGNNAWNLLNTFQPPQADEDTYRDLLTSVLSYVLGGNRQTQTGMSTAQNFYHQIDRIAPLVEKYAPSRTAELREWSQAVERTLDPQVKMYQEMHKISQNGTVDEMMALAAKYPPEFRTLLYQNAAWKAVTSGDSARAKEIAEMIPDPAQRRQVLDQLENQTASAAEGNNKIVEAQRLVDKGKNLNQKIEIILRTASAVAAEGDKKAALELLNEAKIILASSPQSAAQLNGRVRLAQAYLKLDPDQTFSVLQPLIIKLNELVAAAAVLDGIDFQYLKDGEWVMPGTNNLGNVINSLDQTLAALGQIDFDRARSLADQIERPEVRVLVEIDLAQITLGGKPMNLQMFGGRGMSGSAFTIIN